MAEFTILSRPCRTTDGVFHPAEPLTAVYDEQEEEVMGALTRRMRSLPEGPERSAALNELRCLHEAKALLGARILSPEERIALLGEEEMSPVEALAVIQAHNDAHPDFKVPQKAMDEIAREGGQTTLLPPEGTTPLPMPHDDDPEPPAWSTPSPLSAPASAVSRLPDFDGETYCRALDHERLGAQLLRVGREMADGQWHTLSELAAKTEDPEASISARLRDLRKRKFGGHTVNRERMENGLWRYRLVRQQYEQPWGEVAA